MNPLWLVPAAFLLVAVVALVKALSKPMDDEPYYDPDWD